MKSAKARKRKAKAPRPVNPWEGGAVLGVPSRNADVMAEDRGYDEAQGGREYMLGDEHRNAGVMAEDGRA